MLAWAIIFTVVLVACGIVATIAGFVVADGGKKLSKAVTIGCAAMHVIFLCVATMLYCRVSPKASLACGILFTITTCAFIIIQCCCVNNGFFVLRATAMALSFANLICATVGYVNTYAFFAFAVSLVVILGLAGLNIGLTFGFEVFNIAFHVTNIILAVCAVAGCIVGFCLDAKIADGVTVEAKPSVYKYDADNSTLDKSNQTELYLGNYYAIQYDFKWKNLMAYTTSSDNISIRITFPEAVDYIAEGVKFKASENKKVWTYDFELNSMSQERLKSGYFILNYSNSEDVDSIPVKTLNVHISAKSSEIFREYDSNYTFTVKKKNYSFTNDNCVKDLSQSDDGCYRLTSPEGCESFTIKFYDKDKTGLYCSQTVDVKDGNYMLAIQSMLQDNVAESVYNKIVKNKESVIVEITAVGNDDYSDTSISFAYTIE